jgi:hypothetical protein
MWLNKVFGEKSILVFVCGGRESEVKRSKNLYQNRVKLK